MKLSDFGSNLGRNRTIDLKLEEKKMKYIYIYLKNMNVHKPMACFARNIFQTLVTHKTCTAHLRLVML